jgi:hypothetical protein
LMSMLESQRVHVLLRDMTRSKTDTPQSTGKGSAC